MVWSRSQARPRVLRKVSRLSRRIPRFVIAGLLVLSATVSAQWTDIPRTGLPLTPTGAVDLEAPVLRGPDGKPVLSGTWQITNPAYLSKVDIPFQPWAKLLFESRGRRISRARGSKRQLSVAGSAANRGGSLPVEARWRARSVHPLV